MDTINFTFNLLFYFIIIVSLDYTICKDDVLVKSCPEDKASWDTAARRKECKPDGSKNYVYHCLKNERQELVETCLVAQWIEIGVCPNLFNGGNFGFENCTLIMLRTGGACPKEAYHSNELYRFPICFEILPKTTVTQLNAATEITTVTVTSGKPRDGNSSRNATNGNKNAKTDHDDSIDIGVIVIVVLLVIIIGIVVGLFILERRRGALPYGIILCNDVEQGQERTNENVPFIQRKPSTQPPEKKIVQLAAFTEGFDILNNYGILIITGQIGGGKTTAMEHIIQRLEEQDREWKVKDVSFLRKSCSSNEKIIIRWDDCFGKFVTNPSKQENTKNKLEEVPKWMEEGVGYRKIILTMREKEFTYFTVEDLLKTTNCKVCVDNLSKEEKTLLVENISNKVCTCDNCSGIHWEKVTKELNKETESIILSLLGWPLICRLATIPDVAKNIGTFRKDPFRCVMRLFDDLQSTNQQLYFAMVYVLFKRGNMNICKKDLPFLREISENLAPDMIQPAKYGEHLEDAENSEITDKQVEFVSSKLYKVFCTHHYFFQKDEECFKFHHEIFVLWLLCHYYKRFPKMTIQHLEYDILTELLRPISYAVEQHESDIETLCSFEDNVSLKDDKNKSSTEYVQVGKDKTAVACAKDDSEKVFLEDETNIQTISNDAFQQSEEKRSESEKWKFTLKEDMLSSFIQRVETERVEVLKKQGEQEQKCDMLKGHPLLENKTLKFKYDERVPSLKTSNVMGTMVNFLDSAKK